MNKESCIMKIARGRAPVFVTPEGTYQNVVGENQEVVGKDIFTPKEKIPMTKEEMENEEAKLAKKEDLKPWLAAGGAGLLAHYLASSIMGDEVDNKNKSTWYKLLAKLLPIGAAGLGAWGGYALGKNAQAKEEQPKKGPVRDLRKEYEDLDYSPWGRWLTAGGFGTAGAGSAVYGVKNLWDLYKAPAEIQALSPAQIAQNQETIRRISETDIPYARQMEGTSANIRTSAENIAQQIETAQSQIRPNQKGTAKELAANMKALQDANDVAHRNAPYTGKTVSQLEAERAALENANLSTMKNPNHIAANGWRFWKNPKLRRAGGGLLGAVLSAIPAFASGASAMQHNEAREAARQRYEKGLKALYGD